MATKGPLNQVQKARQVSRVALGPNGSAISAKAESLFSILESGQDTLYLRNHADDLMEEISRPHSLQFTWAEFRMQGSIVDKISYLVGSEYGNLVNTTGVGGVTNIDDTNWGTDNDIAVKQILNEVINKLEEKLLKNQDFSESWIVRHSASNRFDAKLTDVERNTLDNTATSLQKIAKDEGFDLIVEAMHLKSESDTQKIIKISEAISMLAKAEIKIDKAILDQFTKLNEKIKPLRDLDRSYKHMTAMIHAVHDINKNHTLGLTVKDEEQFLTILSELEVKDPSEYFITAEDDTTLDIRQKLLLLKNKNIMRFNHVLKKNGIKESAFTKQFVGYYSYKNLEQAKADFQAQKAKTFGTKLPMFENDVSSWRGMARNRILDVYDNRMSIVNGFRVFNTDADAEFVNSYFTKFRDLFYASEKDPENHDKIRQIIAALLRRKVSILSPGSRKFGVSIERKWKGLLKKTRILQDHLDDAEWIAEIIMNDHLLTNDFYHNNTDIFHTDESKVKYSKALRRSKIGKAGVKNVIAPATTTAAALSEAALFGGAKVGLGAMRGISGATSALSRVGKKTFGAVNKGLSKALYEKGYKWRKTPLYPIQWAAYLTEKGMEFTEKGAQMVGKGSKKGSEIVDKGHHKIIDMMNENIDESKEGEKKVKFMFQGLGRVWRNANEFMGKKIAEKQEDEFQNAILGQQRSAVNAFLELSKVDKELGPLMQSVELCEMLNFKDTGPYLFDEDGRTMNINRVKKDANTPEAAAGALEKSMEKHLEKLMQQADEQYNKANQANMDAKRSGDVTKMGEADIDFAHSSVVRSNVQVISGDIARIQPILKSPLDQNGQWRQADMNTSLTSLNDHLNNQNTGLLHLLRDEVGNQNNGLIQEKSQAHISLLQQTAAEASSAALIKSILNQISTYKPNNNNNNNNNNQNYLADLHNRLQGAQDAQSQAIQDKATAEEKYTRLSRELMNKKQLLAWFEIIDQFRNNLQNLSDEMSAAITNAQDTKPIVDQMNSLAKHLDLMLYPEEKKRAKIINLAEAKSKIDSIGGIDESTKNQIIDLFKSVLDAA